MFRSNQFCPLQRVISLVLIISLAFSPSFSYAQSAFVSALPEPGTMLGQSVAFVPVLVKGLVIHPDKPLNFDFIVDSGNDSVDQSLIKEESGKIVKYFLAALTVPESSLWVNLSPYEKDRIIDEGLGQTLLGRDMLAQDYVLKQLTASMIYPEDQLGKDFWARVYKEAQEKFGTTDIPVDTFNKVWIVPQKAVVFEKDNAVYVTEAKLKVMLDSDHAAMAQSMDIPRPTSEGLSSEPQNDKVTFAKEILRTIILPAIEKEVNTGRNFATLRQVYYAAILAKWYRELVQDTLMARAYIGTNKIDGVNTDDKTLKDQIYQRYIAAYKKGVFNMIKEEPDLATGETIPRKYFSGGLADFAIKDVPLERTTDASMSSVIGRLFKLLFVMQSSNALEPSIMKMQFEAKRGDRQRAEIDAAWELSERSGYGETQGVFGYYWQNRITGQIVNEADLEFSWGVHPTNKYDNAENLLASLAENVPIEAVVDVEPMDLKLKADASMLGEVLEWTIKHPYLITAGFGSFIGISAVTGSVLVGGLKEHVNNFFYKRNSSHFFKNGLDVSLNLIIPNPLLAVPLWLNPFVSILVLFPMMALGSDAGLSFGGMLALPYITQASAGVSAVLSSLILKEVIKRRESDAAMLQITSSALAVNVDPSMVNEVVQWVQNHPILTVAGVITSTVVAVKVAGNWVEKNTVKGNIFRAKWIVLGIDERLAAIIWLSQNNSVKANEFLNGLLKENDGMIREMYGVSKTSLQILVSSPNLKYLEMLYRIRQEVPVWKSFSKSEKVAEFFDEALQLLNAGYDFNISYWPEERHSDGYRMVTRSSPEGGIWDESEEQWVVDRPEGIIIAKGTKIGGNDSEASDLAINGGIDINNIGIEKKSPGGRVQFNDVAIKGILEGGFNGFTPVFIQMTPIASPLMLLGGTKPESKEEKAS